MLTIRYDLFNGPKFHAQQQGIGHQVFDKGSLGDNTRAMMTAWFACFLTDNDHACSLFADGTCDAFEGEWTMCQGDNLSF